MRGPKPQYPIQLTDEEKQKLEKLVRATRTPQGIALRARILLLAHEHPEWSNQRIARKVGCTDWMVRKWRRRWSQHHSIEDLPRPGAPRRFPAEVRAQATALACSCPKEEKVPLARWSAAEITRQLREKGVSPVPSPSTIRRWLGEEQLKPWRYRYWQKIQDPVAFLERARPILRLYERAAELLQEGTWVICIDEKTSLQARQRETPTLPAVSGEPMHVAPRYRRRGALHLFSALSVADGQVYGMCFPRKRFVDFQTFFREEMVPEALRRQVVRVAIIQDNSSTHAPKRLEKWLAELEAELGGQLSFQVYWLPKNASWLNQLEIWFSILQRKVLQPNDFENLEEEKNTILNFIQRYDATAVPIRWSYTVAKLEAKLGAN